MYLVIAEKPELGHAVAAAMPGPQQDNKAEQTITKTWRGAPVTIIWCYGHLLTLVEPEEYDQKYAGEWKMENLPFFFDDWRLAPKPGERGRAGTKQRVEQIRKLLKQSDVVIHAGDIDDEGQLLVDEILRYCGYQGKVLRLNTNDTSRDALKKALDNMDDNNRHISSGLAAYGRQMSDKAFGYNLTQYYSILNGRTLRVGRVKMPTLGLVVQRDALIESHKKTMHFSVDAIVEINGESVSCRFVPNKEDPHIRDGIITDRAYVESIAARLNGASLRDIRVTTTRQKEPPPLPFNLVKLYAYCSNKWGMQPGKVRAVTQALRSKYHAITYNRTNCQYLSTAMFYEAPGTAAAAANNIGKDPDAFDTTIKSRCFDDDNVTEHTAIIPTNSRQDLSKFSEDERNVYEAIALYYLAQFLPPAEKEVTRLEAQGPEGGKLTATSTVLVSPGYRTLLGGADLTRTEEDAQPDTGEDCQSVLSNITPGQYHGLVKGTKLRQQETKPPPRYTAATLIADMTSIAKYVTNPAVKELLLKKDKGKKDEHGSIGTPATRDTIVKELIDAGYLREETKGRTIHLISTQMGREFYHVLPDSVRKVDVSAKWWCEQEQIRAGEITPNQMARDVLRTVSAIIKSGEGKMVNAATYANGITSGEPLGGCPKCGATHGGQVFESDKGFKCANETCDFFIYKQNKFFSSLGKQLTAKAVQIMLRDGRIAVRSCKSRGGRTYDATIICDFTTGKYPSYSFAKDEQLASLGRCPKCGGSVVDKGKGFACIGEGCRFVIWKSNGLLSSIGKRQLTESNVKDLLKFGKCQLKNCRSAKNPERTYSCYYVLDWSGDTAQATLSFDK